MTVTDTAPAMPGGPEPGGLRTNWKWMLALGIAMIAIGIVGLGMSYRLTLAAMLWFGVLAVVAGILQLFDVGHHRGWKPMVWHVLIALVYVVAGGFMIALPVKSAFILTLVIALSLIATGIMRIFISFSVRRAGGPWLWVLLLGLLSVVLGVAVYGLVVPPGPEALATPEGQLAWLRSWGWVIGLFISAEFVGQGLSLIAIGYATRSARVDPGA